VTHFASPAEVYIWSTHQYVKLIMCVKLTI